MGPAPRGGVQQPGPSAVTAQITQPADACRESPAQRPAPVLGALAAAGQRQAASNPACTDSSIARSGMLRAMGPATLNCWKNTVGGPMRHAAHGGAQAIHVVERRGVRSDPIMSEPSATGSMRKATTTLRHRCRRQPSAVGQRRCAWCRTRVEGVAARPAGELLATRAAQCTGGRPCGGRHQTLKGLRRGLISAARQALRLSFCPLPWPSSASSTPACSSTCAWQPRRCDAGGAQHRSRH